MAKKQNKKRAAKPAGAPAVETSVPDTILDRIVPVGVREDGRMYYVSDSGLTMTVSRLPHIAISNIIRHIETPNSALYAAIENEVKDMEEFKASMYARLDEVDGKLLRAFDRFKAKGLYAPNINGLRALMKSYLPLNLGWPLDMILDMATGLTGLAKWDANIADEIWLNCIELDMYLFHREVYMNDAETMQWGGLVGQDYEIIWILVFWSTYGSALQHDMAAAHDEIERAHESAGQLGMLVDTVGKYESYIASEREKFEKRFSARDGEIAELRTDNGRLVRENQKLKEKLALMEESIRVSEEEVECEFDDNDAIVQADESETFQYELPESGILFVGGHQRLQNKLKAMYPKWKFVTTKMSYSLLDDNVKSKFVFFYTGHLSHKLFDKVRDSMDGVPSAYVASQNMNLLNSDMLRAYNDYMAGLESE